MSKAADPASKYANAVIAERITAGKLVKLAGQRHKNDRKQQKKKKIVWCPELANHAINFFKENLCLSNGRPFVLEPFQEFIVGSLFGWYNSNGFRRFRTAYVEAGKGSGKTPLAAGIGLYGLISDSQDEPEAEIYSAAVSRDQASITFKDACNLSTSSPVFAEFLRDDKNRNGDLEVRTGSIVYYPTRSVLKPVSSEHRGLDGKRVHIALVDELHEHPHGMVVDKMRAGTKARRNALIFEITNSGYDRTSVCWHHHEYSIKILEGTEDNESWFAYVCQLDEGDDWKDEKCWLKANPGINTILPIEYIREQVREAEGMPSKENIVKRLNFCIWTEQSTRWLNMDDWRNCKPRRPKAELLRRDCFGGIDLSSKIDISAYVLIFSDDDNEGFDVLPFFWIPEASVAKDTTVHSEENRLKLLEFARREFLTITPGRVVDYRYIARTIKETNENYQIKEINFDPWQHDQLIRDLQEEEAPMVECPQGYKGMSTPMKELERLARLFAIRHGGNPVLEWMAGHVSRQEDPAGNIRPDKASSGEKIDGIVALIMALKGWIRHQNEDEEIITNASDLIASA